MDDKQINPYKYKYCVRCLFVHFPTLYRALVKRILRGYIVPRDIPAQIDKIITESKDPCDSTILRSVYMLLQQFPLMPRVDNKRASERVACIARFLEGRPVQSYLDYGCGDGSITVSLADSLGIPREKTYGDDPIMPTAPIVWLGRGDSYKHVGEFPRVDLVTAFVSLHHVRDLYGDLRKIYACLNPGGLFIIREHDCDSLATHLYINSVHGWFEAKKYLYKEEELYAGMRLFSELELRKIILDAGFKFLSSYSYTAESNPQNIYHAAFVKM